MKRVLGSIRRADERYHMIEDGDKVCIGVSGGKDSLLLMEAMKLYQRFSYTKFEVCAVMLDLGLKPIDTTPVEEFAARVGMDFTVVRTDIGKVVFEYREERSPCALCAKLRRGALNNAALEWGANKIALGHHLDDAVETFMMSVMHEGRIGCFSPVTWYDDQRFYVIRPLIYTTEREVKALVRAAELPVVGSSCPENGNTEREEMKKYLRTFDDLHRGLYKRILGALERREIDGWHA